jgi:hypothetical protein
MRRVIFYSVETFIDESHFSFHAYDNSKAMIYTPPLMRKYRYAKFKRLFVPIHVALLVLRGELRNNVRVLP